MSKDRQIEYINRIKPFINLKAICEDYNSKTDSPIDYNNLRAVLNGISTTRVSQEKLNCFIDYLYNDLFINVFEINNLDYSINVDAIDYIIEHYSKKMRNQIIEEFIK